jgi:hypothetical protein
MTLLDGEVVYTATNSAVTAFVATFSVLVNRRVTHRGPIASPTGSDPDHAPITCGIPTLSTIKASAAAAIALYTTSFCTGAII